MLDKFRLWMYEHEQIDPKYSSRPGFCDTVKKQGAFNKDWAKPVMCYHLIENSKEQLLGCNVAYKVVHQFDCF
jgi:hypothetical protein